MEDHRTPGQLIEALLVERGWSQRTLALVMGKGETTINKIVAAKQPLDPETALLLEEVFDIPADKFLALQRAFDLGVARLASKPDAGRSARAHLFSSLPISEMIKRGWLDAKDPRDISAVESSLMKFFGETSPHEIEVLPHAARKTMVNAEPTPTQMAWLYRVQAIAGEMLVCPFNIDGLRRAISDLKNLTSAPEEARKVPRILAECGVRFVVVESLSNAKIDGVCFWLNEKSPVIGLSLRFDRIDNFWFVLRHEIEHVLQGHGRSAVILDAELEGENAGTSSNIPEEERMANAAASEFCIPQKHMTAFIDRKSPMFSDRDLIGFARSLGVHPGIVAGQLQFRTKRYDIFRQHLAKVRNIVLSGAVVDGWGTVAPVGI
jgi:HTH-type transcriptional regulator/antitoxin HigA